MSYQTRAIKHRMFDSATVCHKACIRSAPGGVGGGVLKNISYWEAQQLTLSYTIFDKKGYPFGQIENDTPFTYLRTEGVQHLSFVFFF